MCNGLDCVCIALWFLFLISSLRVASCERDANLISEGVCELFMMCVHCFLCSTVVVRIVQQVSRTSAVSIKPRGIFYSFWSVLHTVVLLILVEHSMLPR